MTWYILAIVSAFLLALSRMLEKKVLSKEHSLEFNAGNSVFRLIVLLIAAPFIGLSAISLKALAVIFFVSMIATAGLLYRSKATKHMEISDVDPLYNLSPIFVLVLSFLFLGERVSPLNFTGIILVVSAAYLLELDDSHHPLKPIATFIRSKYIHFLIFSLAGFSLCAVLDKVILTSFTTVPNYLFWAFIFISLNFILLDIYRFSYKDVVKAAHTEPLMTFLSGGLHLVNIFLYFTALALPGVMVSLISPLRRSSSLFSTIIGGQLFGEKRLLQKSIACVIMVGGALLLAI